MLFTVGKETAIQDVLYPAFDKRVVFRGHDELRLPECGGDHDDLV